MLNLALIELIALTDPFFPSIRIEPLTGEYPKELGQATIHLPDLDVNFILPWQTPSEPEPDEVNPHSPLTGDVSALIGYEHNISMPWLEQLALTNHLHALQKARGWESHVTTTRFVTVDVRKPKARNTLGGYQGFYHPRLQECPDLVVPCTVVVPDPHPNGRPVPCGVGLLDERLLDAPERHMIMLLEAHIAALEWLAENP